MQVPGTGQADVLPHHTTQGRLQLMQLLAENGIQNTVGK